MGIELLKALQYLQDSIKSIIWKLTLSWNFSYLAEIKWILSHKTMNNLSLSPKKSTQAINLPFKKLLSDQIKHR